MLFLYPKKIMINHIFDHSWWTNSAKMEKNRDFNCRNPSQNFNPQPLGWQFPTPRFPRNSTNFAPEKWWRRKTIRLPFGGKLGHIFRGRCHVNLQEFFLGTFGKKGYLGWNPVSKLVVSTHWKIVVKLDHSPNFRDEHKNISKITTQL